MNLDHLLSSAHRNQGLHMETDDDFIYLYTYSEGIGVYRSRTAITEIIKDADRYLAASKLQREFWSMKNEIHVK